MEVVARVEFEPQRLLNHGEYQLCCLSSRSSGVGCRATGHGSNEHGRDSTAAKGSASSEDCHVAYRSINSKRLDFLVVNAGCIPVLAISIKERGTTARDPSCATRSSARRCARRTSSSWRFGAITTRSLPSRVRSDHGQRAHRFRSRSPTGAGPTEDWSRGSCPWPGARHRRHRQSAVPPGRPHPCA